MTSEHGYAFLNFRCLKQNEYCVISGDWHCRKHSTKFLTTRQWYAPYQKEHLNIFYYDDRQPERSI